MHSLKEQFWIKHYRGRNNMKKTLLLLPLVTLTNCMYFDKMKSNKQMPSSEFHRTLNQSYSNMAKENMKGFDWIDANLFAKKAHLASKNKDVMPEDPTKWNLKGELMVEFQEYHDAVMMLNTPKNKEKHPKHLANLISSFDDMLEVQVDDANLEAILAKRDVFMNNIRFFMGESAFLPHSAVVHSNSLFFAKGSHKVGKFGNKVIARSLHKMDGKFSKIMISAHADKVGGAKYNEKMSLERAAAVRNALIAHGVDKNMIEIVNYGEMKPKVNTNKDEMQNRRVDIDFIK